MYKRSSDQTHDEMMQKKPRQADSPPSCVVHARGLPSVCTEAELFALCSPFGNVTQVYFLNIKDSVQALIQFATVRDAENLIAAYSTNPPSLSGRTVYFQFSSRSHISLQPDASAVNQNPPNRILIVGVDNELMPVTIDNFHEIFGRYGQVLRIVCFRKPGLKALIEYADVNAAIHACGHLNRKEIFSGCCVLSTNFSKLTKLDVPTNGTSARDYTVPYMMPAAGPVGGIGGQHMGLGGMGMNMSPYGGYANGGRGGDASSSMAMGGVGVAAGGPGSVLLVNNVHEQHMDATKLFMLFGAFGDVHRVKILFAKRSSALIQFCNPMHAAAAREALNGLNLYGQSLQVVTSKYPQIQLNKAGGEEESAELSQDFSQSKLHRFRNRADLRKQAPPAQVLHLSNLPPSATEATLKELFTITLPDEHEAVVPQIHMFTDSNKEKSNMAFVVMPTIQHAAHALICLHNYQLAGKYLRVSFSTRAADKVGGNHMATD